MSNLPGDVLRSPIRRVWHADMQVKRCGTATRLIIGGASESRAPQSDQTLVLRINKAREWLERLTRQGQCIGGIGKVENVRPGYVTRRWHLALLAPDITQSIAAGEVRLLAAQ